MVSQKKIQTVKEVKNKLENYSVIGLMDMFKLPGRQLHDIKWKLRGKAVIKMVKKRLIDMVLEDSGKDLKGLADYIQGEPALLFSKEDPFKLARMIEESKSKAFAKAGDIAPNDIMVRAGPTNLQPGPVIGELQRAKIPAGVEGEKIVVKQDTIVAKKGDVINDITANVLAKLGIEPIEIGLNLLAVWENGCIYPKKILFTPLEEYIENIKQSHSEAFNLSLSINYFTPDTIPFLLSKAYNEARSLAKTANIITKDTIGLLLSKADAEASSLQRLIKE